MLGMHLIGGILVCGLLSACGAVQQGDNSSAKNQAARATEQAVTTPEPASSAGTGTNTGVHSSVTNEEFTNWVTKYECWTTSSISPGGGCSRTVLQLSNQGGYRLFSEYDSSADVNTLPKVAALPDMTMIASGTFTTNQPLVADGPTVTITLLSQVTRLGVIGAQHDADMANSNQTCALNTWRLGNFIYFNGPVPADPACQALVQGKAWPDLAQAKLTATAQMNSALHATGVFEPAEPESLQLNLLVDGLPLHKGLNQFFRVNSR